MTRDTDPPKRRRRRARPLLVAVGAVVLAGCNTMVHGVVAQHCPTQDGCIDDFSVPVEPTDMGPADLKEPQD